MFFGLERKEEKEIVILYTYVSKMQFNPSDNDDVWTEQKQNQTQIMMCILFTVCDMYRVDLCKWVGVCEWWSV